MGTTRVAATAMLVCALVASAALAGCGEAAKANDAIDRANAQIAAYNSVDQEVGRLLEQAAATDQTPLGAKKGMAVLAEASSKLGTRKTTLAKARAEFAAIAGMDVSEESKVYAQKEIATIEALEKLDVALAGMIGDMSSLMNLVASGSKDVAKAGALSKSLQVKQKRLQELEASSDKLDQEARTYFDDNLK
jgi:hypothetical protein